MIAAEDVLCGIDTGGTFTDCILVIDGRVVRAKAPSTPHDFSVGFFESLTLAAAQVSVSVEELAPRLTHLVYGTTVATNSLVQRTGARTGLLATEGFGDTLLMMRGIGRVTGVPADHLAHLAATSKPPPLVPRMLTAEVPERIDCFGDVVVPLDEAACRHAIEALLELDVESIAIAFLWSFANSSHEERAREIVREIAPDIYVSCSFEIAPKLGEYERTAATAINAYLGPVTREYMDRVGEQAHELGVSRSPLVLQCSGGALPIRQAGDLAVLTIGSGPTAGVVASADLARRLGLDNVICADVGGTTFDVGLVHAGEPLLTDVSIASQYRYYAPSVDVQSIGAGGGSVAWVDEASSTLRVGPHSAGADPGPAAYARGGTEPTVTDACLVLGYLDAERPLAGRVHLDAERARAAVARVAAPLGLGIEEAAAGVVRIAEMHMADLLRKVTIQRGLDPADFVLLAYGGGGPVHAGGFGSELGVERIIVPLGDNSSLWSAFGAAVSDVRKVFEVSRVLETPIATEELGAVFTELEDQARQWLEEQGFARDGVDLNRRADLRYKAQVHQVTIPIRSGDLRPDDATSIVDEFEAAYAALYGEGTGYRAAGIELAALAVDAVGRIPKPDLLGRAGDAVPCSSRTRRVWWPELGDWVETTVLAGESLRPDDDVHGPAIVEFLDTTLVVHPTQAARRDDLGNVELHVGV